MNEWMFINDDTHTTYKNEEYIRIKRENIYNIAENIQNSIIYRIELGQKWKGSNGRYASVYLCLQ